MQGGKKGEYYRILSRGGCDRTRDNGETIRGHRKQGKEKGEH